VSERDDFLPFKHNTVFAAEFHAFEHNYTTMRTMEFINITFKIVPIIGVGTDIVELGFAFIELGWNHF
jgi:hypothetical protein